ncbi:hypothetical protein [Enterovibrio calviensis]|uniref:hypothetical protein n=1 Tax=Enterovibrio calviensis TaxID=91359 RepID=UPI00048A2F50|nr:hypothetical protein [Enterovibrio calviensis]
MAAEKLTTGRLIQILVVMAVLIAAFTWRTFDYSDPTNVFQCEIVEGYCQVITNGGNVGIELKKQSDTTPLFIVNSSIMPSSLYVKSDAIKTEFEVKNIKVTDNNRAHLYALSDNVKYRAGDQIILIIDRDQIEINF